MRYGLSSKVTVLGKVIIKPDKSFSFLSYLVRGDKTVLIDTVPQRSGAEFLEDVEACVPLENLDALILNHSEEDHSGALGLLLERRPDLPIYCTEACRNRLLETHPKAHFVCVENGGTLALGELEFRFIHTPGLHWADNMVTYWAEEGILFSNDLFGQFLGAMVPLDETLSKEAVRTGARGYFEAVFSTATPAERAVVADVCKLEIARVAPGHGVVLQTHLKDVLEDYRSACGG